MNYISHERGQTRILIAERRAAVRSALKGFLQKEPGLHVVNEAADSQELLHQIEATCPDLVLLDWDLLDESEADLIRALRQGHCQPRVIVLSVRPESAPAALGAGADAFFYKGDGTKRLLTVIRGVLLEGDMHSDLLVVTFDSEEGAGRVRDALQRMHKSPLLGLENALVVTVDGAGIVSLQPGGELPAPQGGDLLEVIVGLIFADPPNGMLRRLVEQGLDDRFVDAVARTTGKNTSALLFLVRYDGVSDTVELLDALAPYNGKTHLTTLSPDVEAALLKNR